MCSKRSLKSCITHLYKSLNISTMMQAYKREFHEGFYDYVACRP